MGGAFRFISLLAAPFPPVLHRPTSVIFQRLIARRSSTTSTRRLILSHPSANCHRPRAVSITKTDSFRKELHAQAINSDRETINSRDIPTPINHPWPEWSRLVDTLLSSEWNRAFGNQGHEISPDDAFVVYEEKKLPDEFIHYASVCLAFSRSRPELISILSRKDMEVIVANGTPFLFKSALDVARRLRVYLGMEGGNVLEQKNSTFADIMKYILSYACYPSVSDGNTLYSKELVESSARNILRQMSEAIFGDPAQKFPASGHQFSGRYEQKSTPLRQNVEMKRGDWICQKCSFMNFARNLKCLECEESRPHKQLTGQEWNCPQCKFYNYGRNSVCLRCDCKRPGSDLANKISSTAELAFVASNMRSTSLPESASLSTLENESSLTARKSPVEQRQVKDQSQKTFPKFEVLQNDISEGPKHFYGLPIKQNLTNILHQASPASRTGDPTITDNDQTERSRSSGTTPRSVSHSDKAARSTEFLGQSESDGQNKGNNQIEESKNWIQRVAELHNVGDLPSAISDEDFPEIMPMRKGENRFVINKKKDRSLTSPAYKRHAASGQENSSTNFVPFVPFPPGYFARNETPVSASENSANKSSTETSPGFTENNAIQEEKGQLKGIHDNSNLSLLKEVDVGGRSSQSSSCSTGSEHETSGNFGKENTSEPMNSAGGNLQLPNRNANSGWTAKSLEGSAVKEPNSLDMSEEAKAERWFRRVAQIKDISELSQIPDEDFPSIMPMRKGVNRFVVSKRKTPLERRLTSQYKRNLPTVSSDPLKENDSK